MNKSLLKFIALWLCLLMINALVFAGKICSFKEFHNPSSLRIYENRLYITENTTIFIYSFVDFKFIKKFGKPGEGPREFKHYVKLYFQNGNIFVNSSGKISRFTKDGEFLKEQRLSSGSDFIPIGNHYVGATWTRKEKTSFITTYIFDKSFNKKKLLKSVEGTALGAKFLNPITIWGPLGEEFSVYKDLIFCKIEDGFNIFDKKGDVMFHIDLNAARVPVTGKDKENYLSFYRTNPRTRRSFAALKQRFKFPRYFPVIRDYRVSGDRLYIITFNQKSGKNEILVYKTDDKFEKKIFLKMFNKNLMEYYPFTFYNNSIYQLVENERSEEIELFRKELND